MLAHYTCMKGMVSVRKIQIKAFDRRRNQMVWFHFCYLEDQVWEQYYNRFQAKNLDVQIRKWLRDEFGFEVVYMDDIYEAKEFIKRKYAEKYPDIYLDSEGDKQGWTRVWLTDKIQNILEEDNNE